MSDTRTRNRSWLFDGSFMRSDSDSGSIERIFREAGPCVRFAAESCVRSWLLLAPAFGSIPVDAAPKVKTGILEAETRSEPPAGRKEPQGAAERRLECPNCVGMRVEGY